MLSKNDFSIFKYHPDLVYLDAAATSQKPQAVIDAISEWYQKYNSNIHRSNNRLSIIATNEYEKARSKIADYFNVNINETVFIKNTTEGINILALGLSKHIKEGDNIIISQLEHHSNLLPWRVLARQKKAKLQIVKIKNTRIDWEDFANKIDTRTKIISLTHASNVLGTLQPIDKIANIFQKLGNKDTVVIIDGAQAVPHLQVDLRGLLGNGVDAYVFSGHKVYGPTGIGVMFITNKLAQKIGMVFYGGEMVEIVNENNEKYSQLPWRMEAGTPNISGAIGLAKALELFYQDFEKHQKYLEDLKKQLIRGLTKIGVKLISPLDCELPIISFVVPNKKPSEITFELDNENIAVRAGFLCAQPLVEKLNKDGVIRVSLGLWNTKEDIDKFINVIKSIS